MNAQQFALGYRRMYHFALNRWRWEMAFADVCSHWLPVIDDGILF